jgi:hypothetical protein
VRFAKKVYRSLVAPIYRAASVPLYDITSSDKHGYTWFRIPKNGTHSIMEVLNAHAPPDISSSDVPYFSKRHREKFKFCIIRNPWDRLVSVYCNKVEMKLMYPECWDRDFAYFIDFVSRQDLMRCDGHIRLQTAMFPVNEMDYVGRMERFDEDADSILHKVLKLNGRISHRGAVDRPEYSSFYTNDLKEVVRNLYQKDIQYGDYLF